MSYLKKVSLGLFLIGLFVSLVNIANADDYWWQVNETTYGPFDFNNNTEAQSELPTNFWVNLNSGYYGSDAVPDDWSEEPVFNLIGYDIYNHSPYTLAAFAVGLPEDVVDNLFDDDEGNIFTFARTGWAGDVFDELNFEGEPWEGDLGDVDFSTFFGDDYVYAVGFSPQYGENIPYAPIYGFSNSVGEFWLPYEEGTPTSPFAGIFYDPQNQRYFASYVGNTGAPLDIDYNPNQNNGGSSVVPEPLSLGLLGFGLLGIFARKR